MGKNLLVGQSGGPTTAINASLAGVICGGIQSDKIDKIYGARYGVEGILKESFVDLKDFNDEFNIMVLKQTPSAYLGSCRKKLPSYEEDKEIYEHIKRVFEKYDIGYFFYIGGNDSMDTVNKLSKYFKKVNSDVRVIGIPKTIDNDLCLTDHTPGYGSAAKFVANTVKQVAHDNRVYDMPSITIVEIMGRHAGWLTAAAALANNDEEKYADIICLPEIPFDIDKITDKINELLKTKKQLVIALSEGVKTKDGVLLCEDTSLKEAAKDGFNHAQLGGAGKTLEMLLKERINVKMRAIELSTLQRCAATSASRTDIDESFAIGNAGVEYALSGETGVMIGYVRKDSDSYEIEYKPFDTDKVANLEKQVPCDMISDDGMDVTEKFYDYAKTLITGIQNVYAENGIIKTVTVK